MKTEQSQIFFNVHKKLKSSTAILVHKNGDQAFFGVLHTPLDGSDSLLTKAMVIDQISAGSESYYSYKEISPRFVNLCDYEILFSQNRINEFLEKYGAKKDSNLDKNDSSDNYLDNVTENSFNKDFLKSLSKNKLILVEPKEGKIFYLGYTYNPLRDFKQGSNYLTLNDVLTISKKPSPLEGRCNEWQGFDFFDNGITFNTMSKFSVPIDIKSSFYEGQKIVKRLEKEAKRYKPLDPVKNALDYLILQS